MNLFTGLFATVLVGQANAAEQAAGSACAGLFWVAVFGAIFLWAINRDK